MDSLLDTNILSQAIKSRPHPGGSKWLAALPQRTAYISVISILETRMGLELLEADSDKRVKLESWFQAQVLPSYASNILPVTAEIANECGKLLARCRRKRIEPHMRHALIAATALVHNLQIATLNRKHFELLGVKLVSF